MGGFDDLIPHVWHANSGRGGGGVDSTVKPWNDKYGEVILGSCVVVRSIFMVILGIFMVILGA